MQAQGPAYRRGSLSSSAGQAEGRQLPSRAALQLGNRGPGRAVSYEQCDLGGGGGGRDRDSSLGLGVCFLSSVVLRFSLSQKSDPPPRNPGKGLWPGWGQIP